MRYEPETIVTFTSKYLLPDNAKVRYLHGNTVIKTDEIGGNSVGIGKCQQIISPDIWLRFMLIMVLQSRLSLQSVWMFLPNGVVSHVMVSSHTIGF